MARTARTKTVTVSIGRNISGEPMDEDRWILYKADVVDALAFNGLRIVFHGEGVGQYEGAYETSFTLVALAEPRYLAGLYHALARIAKDYDQNSIALTTGETAFPGGDN